MIGNWKNTLEMNQYYANQAIQRRFTDAVFDRVRAVRGRTGEAYLFQAAQYGGDPKIRKLVRRKLVMNDKVSKKNYSISLINHCFLLISYFDI